MAVQKSRKTPSKRGMHRSHSALPLPSVSIDAKSGDRGPSVCVPAAVAAAREFADVRFTLIGRQPELERELGGEFPANVSCLHATEAVEMTDHPRAALWRQK